MSPPAPRSPPDLTRRQRAVLEFLRRVAEEGAPPPTLDEICAALGLSSRGSLHKHIKALVAAGLVLDPRGKQRGIRLASNFDPDLEPNPDPDPAWGGTLPLLGRIAAGKPLEAVASPEQVEVPRSLRGELPCYVLQVRGDSMVDEGILDGDLVVVEQRDYARNGEIVVALVDGSDATLKRIMQRPSVVELWPANQAMSPMQYAPDRVQIQGVVVGQMRSYR